MMLIDCYYKPFSVSAYEHIWLPFALQNFVKVCWSVGCNNSAISIFARCLQIWWSTTTWHSIEIFIWFYTELQDNCRLYHIHPGSEWDGRYVEARNKIISSGNSLPEFLSWYLKIEDVNNFLNNLGLYEVLLFIIDHANWISIMLVHYSVYSKRENNLETLAGKKPQSGPVFYMCMHASNHDMCMHHMMHFGSFI